MRNIVKGPKVTWIDIQDPTKDDVRFLKERFGFHPLVLGELIPPGHRAKTEKHEGYLFIILYYPVYSKEKRETRPRELDIMVTKNTIITSHYRSILPLKSLFDRCNLYKDARNTYMAEGSGQLLFYILSSFWKTCLKKLVQIDKRIDEIEKEIFRGKEREMVSEISLVKTDILNFWRIIEHQEESLRSLEEEGKNFFGQELTPHFADILGTFSQALNSLKTFKEAISSLEDTNQSLLSTKTNEIIRILTVFSVIVMPLTLIVSVWGMNVGLPFADSPYGFLVILGIMAFAATFMLLYFKKKSWM